MCRNALHSTMYQIHFLFSQYTIKLSIFICTQHSITYTLQKERETERENFSEKVTKFMYLKTWSPVGALFGEVTEPLGSISCWRSMSLRAGQVFSVYSLTPLPVWSLHSSFGYRDDLSASCSVCHHGTPSIMDHKPK